MILVIAAMEEEVSAFKKRMSECVSKNIHNTSVYEGLVDEKRVVLALSGVGKVNAAITASTLLSHYKIDYCINIGSAGGLLKGQKVGDVVISKLLQYHDLDIGEKTLGDPRFMFYSHDLLVDQVCEVLENLGLNYHVGQVVAGDQFVTKDSDAFVQIQKKFPKAQAVDMESAAIAASCQRFKVPFVVVRALSDVTFEKDNDLTFEAYLALASENSASICEALIKKEFAI